MHYCGEVGLFAHFYDVLYFGPLKSANLEENGVNVNGKKQITSYRLW